MGDHPVAGQLVGGPEPTAVCTAFSSGRQASSFEPDGISCPTCTAPSAAGAAAAVSAATIRQRSEMEIERFGAKTLVIM